MPVTYCCAMLLAPPRMETARTFAQSSPDPAPARPAAPIAATQDVPAPAPPASWARWWTSPIAVLRYEAVGEHATPFAEARIPAQRTLTGALTPALRYGGPTEADAVAAARMLAQETQDVDFGGGEVRSVHPAIAVLRDARHGAWWLAPLQTTVRRGTEWIEAPHTIDGAAFTGPDAWLRSVQVHSNSRVLVAVVGADTVLRPTRSSATAGARELTPG